MGRRTTRITMTTMAIALLLAASATAQRPGAAGARQGSERGLGGPGHDPGRLIEFLELDEAQAEQWRAAHERNREQVQPLFEEMRRLHQELDDALESDAPDATFVGQLVLERHDLRRQVEGQREVFEAELAQILNQEQLARWEAFKEARRERRPRRSQGGLGSGGSGPGFPGG